jgi:hypothetical protein
MPSPSGRLFDLRAGSPSACSGPIGSGLTRPLSEQSGGRGQELDKRARGQDGNETRVCCLAGVGALGQLVQTLARAFVSLGQLSPGRPGFWSWCRGGHGRRSLAGAQITSAFCKRQGRPVSMAWGGYRVSLNSDRHRPGARCSRCVDDPRHDCSAAQRSTDSRESSAVPASPRRGCSTARGSTAVVFGQPWGQAAPCSWHAGLGAPEAARGHQRPPADDQRPAGLGPGHDVSGPGWDWSGQEREGLSPLKIGFRLRSVV